MWKSMHMERVAPQFPFWMTDLTVEVYWILETVGLTSVSVVFFLLFLFIFEESLTDLRLFC